ncbi:hypothetical protein LTR85_003035 [Meristemomyces frigidus]|nr:hypothetical protein LTR85_003035 [Meristemomyces frigidus]
MSDPARCDVSVMDEGDIILALREQVYVRVSSFILSNASPVFKAMFGPHFSEGHHPGSSNHPKEITLPDDSSGSMKQLCHLLHGQDTDSTDAPTVSLQTEAMLSRFLNRITTGPVGIECLAHLTQAAYLLSHPRHFYIFTKRMVLDYHVPLSMISSASGSILPAEILLKLESQRGTARLMVLEGIPRMAYNERCARHTGCNKFGTGEGFAHDLARALQPSGQ